MWGVSMEMEVIKFVYLIRSLDESHYKIGVSKNPKNRLKQLQTANSSKLKLMYSYPSNYATKIERALQRRYSHYQKEGEWFRISLSEEYSFVNDCKKIETNLILLKSKY